MKLHVGNLPKETTDAELLSLAAKFGAPTSSSIVRERDGQSKGFAFLEFASSDEAQAALSGMNGQEVAGRALKVSLARKQAPVDPLGGRF
ncbi:MAG TPA: hypothetical protein VF057_05690 [Thermoanaerobaculia bacterium]